MVKSTPAARCRHVSGFIDSKGSDKLTVFPVLSTRTALTVLAAAPTWLDVLAISKRRPTIAE
jgi:hypothetical protein